MELHHALNIAVENKKIYILFVFLKTYSSDLNYASFTSLAIALKSSSGERKMRFSVDGK